MAILKLDPLERNNATVTLSNADWVEVLGCVRSFVLLPEDLKKEEIDRLMEVDDKISKQLKIKSLGE